MVTSFEELVPAEWRGAARLLAAPMQWISAWLGTVINAIWYGHSLTEVVLKRTLVLGPVLLLSAALWTTVLAMYTLPFRSGRGSFLTSLLMAWWDAGRCIWLFWTGLVRLGVVTVGWIWSLLRFAAHLAVSGVVWLFRSPLALLDWTSRRYFQPGVPWLAFLVLLLWSAVEATVFTFTLSPTMTEVLAGLTGAEPSARVMAPMLWVFLFLLISGSFACVHVLAESVKARKRADIVQMVVVELFVMFFEVIFLYRELIDAVTPWVAQQSGGRVQLGLGATIALACFGWMGVRGMTWFLFGRFGTPALLAILSRQAVAEAGAPARPAPPMPDLWSGPVAALKAEAEWFKGQARELFGLLTIPVLQLLAAALNFAVVAVQSRPAFVLPFSSLDDMLAAAPFGHGAEGGGVSAARAAWAPPAPGATRHVPKATP